MTLNEIVTQLNEGDELRNAVAALVNHETNLVELSREGYFITVQWWDNNLVEIAKWVNTDTKRGYSLSDWGFQVISV